MNLKVLGGLELTGANFARPKPLLLLAYLALEGPRERRHLAELFWPDAADPMNSLSAALKQLRHAGGGLIGGDNVQLRFSSTCDARVFLEHADAGREGAALGLYRSPFLGGVCLPGWSAELEEWVYATREFLAGRVRQLLLLSGEAKAARGDLAEAVRDAEGAYRLPGAAQPEPEEFIRLHQLLAAGESAHLHTLRQEARSFGLELPARAGTHVRLPSTGEGLPTRHTSFVGRDAERLEIANRLAREGCALLTLTGPGGVGKSRLALQVGHDLAARYAGRVYFIALEALTRSDQIPAGVAEGLGLRLQGSDDPLAQVVRHIGDQDLLIILDNYEHLVDGAVQVSQLLQRCPNLKLLVTSRERLNLEEEWVLPLGGLAVPASNVRADTPAHDAVVLFLERAKRARLTFAPTPAELPHVVHICQQVQGLPLGLELAAAWVGALSCREIAEEIEKTADFLASASRNVPERHRSLRAVFEGSWRLLTPREQDVLGKLSVFRGGFRREAAAKVAGATTPVLAALVGKSLLSVLDGGRYDVHPLMRQYLGTNLAAQPRMERLARADHGLYYLDVLAAAGTALSGGGQGGRSALVEELENVQAAWAWAVRETATAELRRGAGSLSLFYEVSGRFREGVTDFGMAVAALEAAGLTDCSAFSCVLAEYACHSYRLGLFAEASGAAQRALASARALGEDPLVVRALDLLGQVAWQVGEFDASSRYLEEALALAEPQHDPALTASLIRSIGWVEDVRGNYAEAKRHLQTSLALFRQLNLPHEVVNNLNALGYLHVESGHPLEAGPFFEEGLRLAREAGTQVMVPHLLSGMGLALYELGDYGAAGRTLDKALRETAGELAEAWVLVLLGRTATAVGNYALAESHLRRSLETSWPVQMMPEVLDALVALAELQLAQGHAPRAADTLEAALPHAVLTGYSRAVARNLERNLPRRVTADESRPADGADAVAQIIEAFLGPRG